MTLRPSRTAAALLVATIVTTACSASRLDAQDTERPPLAAGDPNSWQPYFDEGVRIFKHRPVAAERYFIWASRLDPTRPEPLFARYAAFFAHSKDVDIRAYYLNEESIRRRPDILIADSVRSLALMRNPLVHRGLEILIFEDLPRESRPDIDTRAWIAYSTGEFQKAIDLQTRAIEGGGRGARWRRFDRALTYAAMGDNRRALADVRALLDALRADDEHAAATVYESKHFLLYVIGALHMSMRDLASARVAYQEALLENAAFAYGNAGLAAISRMERKNGQAAEEYARAVELAPNDGVLRQWHANVLFDLQLLGDAEAELDKAIALEPHWPAPIYLLGRIRERQGRENDAFDLYARYVSMAPANDATAKALKPRLEARPPRAP